MEQYFNSLINYFIFAIRGIKLLNLIMNIKEIKLMRV